MAIIQLMDPDAVQFNTKDRLYHKGIEIEKGVVITPSFLERNEKLIQDYIQIFSAYPDVLINSTL